MTNLVQILSGLLLLCMHTFGYIKYQQISIEEYWSLRVTKGDQCL